MEKRRGGSGQDGMGWAVIFAPFWKGPEPKKQVVASSIVLVRVKDIAKHAPFAGFQVAGLD